MKTRDLDKMLEVLRPGDTIIYRGGSHIVICRAGEHKQVHVDGTLHDNPMAETCEKWEGGCPASRLGRLTHEVLTYESDTFSASGWKLDLERAEKIASKLIDTLIDAGTIHFDGVHIAAAAEECFPEEAE